MLSIGKECLNWENVNEPSEYYTDDREHWIRELTMFIFTYSKEWREIVEQYRKSTGQSKSRDIEAELEYFRDDEGYLRKVRWTST